MAEEFRTIYSNIPAAVRALFRDAAKGNAAAEKLRAMGLAERDLEVIPITARAEVYRSTPLLERLGLRKSKKAALAALKFHAGETVLVVRLREWPQDKVEATLKDLGADEMEYFPPPGEEMSEMAHVAPARPTD